MRLIWKVLRQHISIGQLAGFVLANIVGLSIIVSGLQLYLDVRPIVADSSGWMKPDYLVVSKPVSTVGSIAGIRPTFTEDEIDDIRSQDFVSQLGVFTAAKYAVSCQLLIERFDVNLVTDMFFESVPDEFVDVESEAWRFEPDDNEIPIIIPRDYLNLYNFGFASSANLPTVSEGMIRMVSFHLYLSGNGQRVHKKGRIVGFSSRLNTILVPESFMEWSNRLLSGSSDAEDVSRVIVQVTNPTDRRIAAYFQAKEWTVDGDKLEASKAGWIMSVLITAVLIIGLVICALAAYVLMLSIFLLVQRNRESISNLKAIGYTAKTIAMPYELLVVATNVVSVLVAMGIMALVRRAYLGYLYALMPDYSTGSTGLVWCVALGLMLLLTGVNVWRIFVSVSKL